MTEREVLELLENLLVHAWWRAERDAEPGVNLLMDVVRDKLESISDEIQ